MSHYCPSCRIERRREANAENMRRIRAVKGDVRSIASAYVLGGMDEARVESVAELVGLDLEDEAQRVRDWHAGLVPDRMPPGANSPAGPDEGYSTYFRELGEDLDMHAAEVARHPWFAANPHWSFRLHDGDLDLELLKAS